MLSMTAPSPLASIEASPALYDPPRARPGWDGGRLPGAGPPATGRLRSKCCARRSRLKWAPSAFSARSNSPPVSPTHILPVFDSGEADGLLFYVMPAWRKSLPERLDDERQLPLSRRSASRARWRRRSTTHTVTTSSTGTSSREHSPPMGRRWSPTSGSARRSPPAHRLRRPDCVGTPAYMSPEQTSARWTPTAGRSPPSAACSRDARRQATIHRRHGAGDHRQAIRLRSQGAHHARCSGSVDAVVTRALARTPVDRFPTAPVRAGATRAQP